jgi:hypothetical protein
MRNKSDQAKATEARLTEINRINPEIRGYEFLLLPSLISLLVTVRFICFDPLLSVAKRFFVINGH